MKPMERNRRRPIRSDKADARHRGPGNSTQYDSDTGHSL